MILLKINWIMMLEFSFHDKGNISDLDEKLQKIFREL